MQQGGWRKLKTSAESEPGPPMLSLSQTSEEDLATATEEELETADE